MPEKPRPTSPGGELNKYFDVDTSTKGMKYSKEELAQMTDEEIIQRMGRIRKEEGNILAQTDKIVASGRFGSHEEVEESGLYKDLDQEECSLGDELVRRCGSFEEARAKIEKYWESRPEEKEEIYKIY